MHLPALNSSDKGIIECYKRLLQLEFPEDAAAHIIAYEDEILRRMAVREKIEVTA
jgi:hypothetical protein